MMTVPIVPIIARTKPIIEYIKAPAITIINKGIKNINNITSMLFLPFFFIKLIYKIGFSIVIYHYA